MNPVGSDATHGRHASKPTGIPWKGWWQIIKRAKTQLAVDQIQIVAAGVAFYLFLALFPVLAASVAIYGLVTDPAEAEQQIASLRAYVPGEAYQVIGEMIRGIASESGKTLGWGVFFSILISLWSANKGTKALVSGLNIAYDEEEQRGFFRLTGLTLCITIGVFLVGALMIALVVGVPALSSSLGLSGAVETAIGLTRWPLLAVLLVLILAVLYRWAPNRDAAKWRWVSPGALVSTVLWLAGSALFSLYIENFNSVSKTYGPFTAVVTLMLWLFLTAYIILLGAEINSESEMQTERDSTHGPSEPMGQRGAYAADHVVGGEENSSSKSQ